MYRVLRRVASSTAATTGLGSVSCAAARARSGSKCGSGWKRYAHSGPSRRGSLPLTIRQLLDLPLSPSFASPAPTSATPTSSPPSTGSHQAQTQTHQEPRIQLNGWIKSIRKQKRVAFAVLSDGSSERTIQAVFSGESVGLVRMLTNGCCVRLSGVLKESIGPEQDREVVVDAVEYLGGCDPEEYPIAKKTLTVDYLRDHTHLRARTTHVAATIRLRDQVQRVLYRFFQEEEFTYVHTPVITANDCEGAGDTFSVVPSSPSPPPSSTTSQPDSSSSTSHPDSTSPPENKHFFNRPAYLTVSSQLHLEALSSSLNRVWTLAPCFRAEKSQTGRHLAEFWMMEAEWAFVDGVGEVCDVVERVVKCVLEAVRRGESLGVVRAHYGVTPSGEEIGKEKLRMLEEAGRWDKGWERMTYSRAVRELRKSGEKFRFEPKWGASLQSEHERYLAERLVGGPVFVTDYPASLKPFYMRVNSPSSHPRLRPRLIQTQKARR
ncbi:hypothetical protein QCA50_016735 [Cerrena zonata]|uniref:Aminoacyl-transfer RNA synthetases class-II family profile domain-containing protein n=1 Tax=Cerrena zonata TaxID=2478898 RepID=A0AAW0FI18_9APHY